MIRETKSLWHRIEPLLREIERPARYINHELNATQSDSSSTVKATDIAFIYPDTYEIGQANQAIAILYDIARQLPNVRTERAFLPWIDMIAKLRKHSIPLFSLESFSELAAFDLIAITMPHELAYTNVLELLDLAGIPLYAADRTNSDPIILGGGPCAFNPEPFAPYFDAISIGEGEESIVELIQAYQAAKACAASREEILHALAKIAGTYVPLLHEPKEVFIQKRILADFDAQPVVQQSIVPFAEVAHDRLTIEILRGCTRGCRFCQAGMMYRPVRERSADTIVQAVAQGLACTGYDEVSITSLSSTDHSQIAEIIRRLNHMFNATGVRLSLPSQRVDAFGVEMAHLVASGERKSSLTFAPEAGTQRLRNIINKNVSENDLIEAISSAYAAGWRRCKLYFMIGLPGETDDDVRGIAELANRAYQAAKDAVSEKERGNCRMSISVAVFIPKAHTPFQWCGQIAREEVQRRIEVLRSARMHRGIDLHWHDPASSSIEAALSRGGRELAPLIELSWRKGARFDAWSEQFKLAAWQEAAHELEIDLDTCAQQVFSFDGVLPWDHISSGVEKDYLAQEYMRSLEGIATPDCSFTDCAACGVCTQLGVDIRLGGARHE